jgi:hypothetical protein
MEPSRSARRNAGKKKGTATIITDPAAIFSLREKHRRLLAPREETRAKEGTAFITTNWVASFPLREKKVTGFSDS